MYIILCMLYNSFLFSFYSWWYPGLEILICPKSWLESSWTQIVTLGYLIPSSLGRRLNENRELDKHLFHCYISRKGNYSILVSCMWYFVMWRHCLVVISLQPDTKLIELCQFSLAFLCLSPSPGSNSCPYTWRALVWITVGFTCLEQDSRWSNAGTYFKQTCFLTLSLLFFLVL